MGPQVRLEPPEILQNQLTVNSQSELLHGPGLWRDEYFLAELPPRRISRLSSALRAGSSRTWLGGAHCFWPRFLIEPWYHIPEIYYIRRYWKDNLVLLLLEYMLGQGWRRVQILRVGRAGVLPVSGSSTSRPSSDGQPR